MDSFLKVITTDFFVTFGPFICFVIETLESFLQSVNHQDKVKMMSLIYAHQTQNAKSEFKYHIIFSSDRSSRKANCQALAPNPLVPNPKPRGLGLTLNCSRPSPITFKHEGGVPQQNSNSKNILEWSPVLVQQKKIQLDSKRKDIGRVVQHIQGEHQQTLSKCQHPG